MQLILFVDMRQETHLSSEYSFVNNFLSPIIDPQWLWATVRQMPKPRCCLLCLL